MRDVASNLERVEAIVLSTREAQGSLQSLNAQAPGVRSVAVYSNAGAHAPAMKENLRAAAWVGLASRADVWHFVFAPNGRTSQMGRWLSRLRNKPVVQTIASPPRSFENVDRLLFGDVVVAQSEFTRSAVLHAYEQARVRAPDIRVIPPPVPLDLSRTAEQAAAARSRLGIASNAPLFIYPGDLEVSSGAEVTREIAGRLAERVPEAVVVFAYRKKTQAAAGIAARLAERVNPERTRIVDSVPDLLALVSSATAVVFPVDDLFGKVDLPIVLLESMVLGVPVVALGQGPLAELDGVELVSNLNPAAWIEPLVRLATDSEARAGLIEKQRDRVAARYGARVVARAYEDIYFELLTASSGTEASNSPKPSRRASSMGSSEPRPPLG